MPLGVVPNLSNQLSFSSYRKDSSGKWTNAPTAKELAAAPAPSAAASKRAAAAAPAPAPSELELAYAAKLTRAKAEHDKVLSSPSAHVAESNRSVASNVTARRLARAQSRSPRLNHAGRERELLKELLGDKESTGLERLLRVGEYCEQMREVSDLDFFEATREFVTAHGWAKDTNGATLDVPELFNLVERWQPSELREAVVQCISDGGLHLRTILDLPPADMRAAFFLEVLEAAAREEAGARDLFSAFITAVDSDATQKAYDEVLAMAGLSGRASLAELTPLLLPVLPHRGRQLLKLLGTRAVHPQYLPKAAGGAAGSMRAVIVGGGPVGLRTAIELAMLGCDVEVLEARERFTRLQVLHLWQWVERDLIELGVKLLDPSIFASLDVRRCGTSQLQHSLFKLSLLLGVRVRFGCKVDSLEQLGALCCRSGQAPLDVLIDASGARCALLESFGFKQTVALRSQRALCIVISLVNHKTREELELRESTWSCQYFPDKFGLLHQYGVRLENLVYYRSSGAFSEAATHYFIMTTDVASLHAFGVLREATLEDVRAASGLPADDGTAQLCQPSNVDSERLELYARAAVALFVPPLATQAMIDGQLSLFDFSERKQSNRAAMLEPFWPEGLGINRGFLGALDCAHLVQHYAALRRERPEDVEECVARRDELFGLTKVVSGHNRKAELRDHLEATAAWRSDAEKAYSYTIQPHTRYLKWGSKEPAPPSKGASAADEEEPVEPRGASLPVEFIASLFG